MGVDVADPVALVIRLKAEKCATCIFRPGNLMDLRPGAVRQMVDNARAVDGHVTCHDTLGPDTPGAICRGFADGPGRHTPPLALRVGRELGCIVEV